MICCYHTKAKGEMCKEIIPIFLCVALLLSFTLPEIGDYTIRELIYGVQDTTTVVRGTRIACEIIAVSNPGYVVYTIYAAIITSVNHFNNRQNLLILWTKRYGQFTRPFRSGRL